MSTRIRSALDIGMSRINGAAQAAHERFSASNSHIASSDSDSNSESDSGLDVLRRNRRVNTTPQFGKDYGPQWAHDLITFSAEFEHVIMHIKPSDFLNYTSIADLRPESDLEEYHQRFQRHGLEEVKRSDSEGLARVMPNIWALKHRIPRLMQPLLLPVIDETKEKLKSFLKFMFREEEQATAGAQDEELYLGGATSLAIGVEEAPGHERSSEGTAGGKYLAAILGGEQGN